MIAHREEGMAETPVDLELLFMVPSITNYSSEFSPTIMTTHNFSLDRLCMLLRWNWTNSRRQTLRIGMILSASWA